MSKVLMVNRIKFKKMKNFSIIYLFQIFLFFSCNNAPTYYAHSSINIPSVNNDEYKCPIDSDAFEVSRVIHLKLPDNVVDVKGTPVFCNDLIYMYDVSREHILVFNSDGDYLHKIGGFGHARNEIVGSICSFDVDSHNNYVHIYNREGMKVLVFDEKGKFVRSVMLHDCLPSSIVISDSGSYIASFDCMSYTDNYSRLVVLDANGKISKILLKSNDESKITCEGVNTRPFYSDHKGHIAYLSTLADSIVYISGDTIQGIFNVNFADGFLSAQEIKQAKQSGKIPEIFKNIQYISHCIVTDDYFLLEYYGKRCGDQLTTNYTYLLNRKTNKDYVFSGYVNFPGILTHTCNIVDNCFISVITEDDVIQEETIYNNYIKASGRSYEEMIKGYKQTPICEDILLRKIKTPAILKIKLK